MYYDWKPYVPVAQRLAKAKRHAAQMAKKGQALSPVTAERVIAKTFWGKAWCDNLERYSDFSNRLPRGRTYVRNGSVIDLKIGEGKVTAQVMGSELYKITVNITAVPAKQWQDIGAECAGTIDSLVELLQGRLSKGVMERICHPGKGLFPSPKEIKFDCSCPDWASMCKHVAAVFYGVGARLDQQPDLLFTLRKVDAKELVARAGAGLPLPQQAPGSAKVLDDSKIAGIFGIEMADIPQTAPPRKAVAAGRKPAVKKSPATRKKKAAPAKKKAKRKSKMQAV
jgi:uncharacterized Zn finger protein